MFVPLISTLNLRYSPFRSVPCFSNDRKKVLRFKVISYNSIHLKKSSKSLMF